MGQVGKTKERDVPFLGGFGADDQAHPNSVVISTEKDWRGVYKPKFVAENNSCLKTGLRMALTFPGCLVWIVVGGAVIFIVMR
jgi:hypothetical protein